MRVNGLESFPCPEKRMGVDHCVDDCNKMWGCPLFTVYSEYLRLQDIVRGTAILLRHFPHIACFGRFATLRMILEFLDHRLSISGFQYRRNWIRAKQKFWKERKA